MNNLGDLLIKIKNAYMARRKSLNVGHGVQKENLVKILLANKYLEGFEVTGTGIKKTIKINLLYLKKIPAVSGVKVISRPGLRVYTKAKAITKVLGGSGLSLVSTPEGLMTGREARKRNLGGEL